MYVLVGLVHLESVLVPGYASSYSVFDLWLRRPESDDASAGGKLLIHISLIV